VNIFPFVVLAIAQKYAFALFDGWVVGISEVAFDIGSVIGAPVIDCGVGNFTLALRQTDAKDGFRLVFWVPAVAAYCTRVEGDG
jgi:hypothetical protein